MVGQAPSPARPEERKNKPFGSRSWKYIETLEQAFPNQIYYTNLLKTPMKAGTNPKKREIEAALPVLLTELRMVQPRRVIAIGTHASKALCPGFREMREDHGALFKNPALNCIVVPTYHFSALARDEMIKRIWIRDMQRFFDLPDPAEPDWIEITSMEQVILSDESKIVLDIETTGFDHIKDNIISLGFQIVGQPDPYIKVMPDKEFLLRMYNLLRHKNCTLIGHNMQFDLLFLSEKTGAHWDLKIEDTMLMAHLAGEEILSLKHLTSMHTDRPGSHAFGSFQDHAYLAEDVLSTTEVYQKFEAQTQGAYSRELLHSLVPVSVGMRRRGMFLDRVQLKASVEVYAEKVHEVLTKLDEITPNKSSSEVNWNSNAQVATILQEHGVKLIEKTKAGAFSVAEGVLSSLKDQHEIARVLLKYREELKQLQFIQGFYGDTSEEHPYVHPRLLLHGTRTGRLSCQDPNIQQIPRVGPLKLAFTSRFPGGNIGLIDLSQAELRVAGILTGDEKFADLLLSDDAHRVIASIIFHKPPKEVSSFERKKSKAVTFGVLYGGSPVGLSTRMQSQGLDVTKEDVELIVHRLLEEFPKLSKWLEKTKKQSVRDGFVMTPFGKRRDLSIMIANEGARSAQRKAVNTPIQATASDIALVILRYTSQGVKEAKLKSRPIMAIHDSIMVELASGEEDLVAEKVQHAFKMINTTPLSNYPLSSKLPLVGEFIIGPTWAHCESTNENYQPTKTYPCSSEIAFKRIDDEQSEPV